MNTVVRRIARVPHRLATPTRIALGAMLAAAGGAALATEYGTVVSSTPVLAQVLVSRQDCRDEQRALAPRTSGGGALLGALVGGAIGNSFGSGAGRAAATGLGVIAGAAIGDQTEAAGQPQGADSVRVCQPTARYENRTLGYDVVYDYNGQRYSARMARDPGPHVALNVSVAPVGAGVPAAPEYAPPPLAYPSPAAVYSAPPAYYASPPVYGVYLGPYGVVLPRIVIGGGYWRGGHWR